LSLSAKGQIEAQAPESGDPFLYMLEISHPTWSTPFYMVDNTVDVVSNGKTYIAWPFDFINGDDDGERLPEVSITIDNVDRRLIEIIRATIDPPSMAIKMVLASDPDQVEFYMQGLTLRDVEYDAFKITWKLFAESLADQRFPADTITMSTGYLGLFRI